MEISSQKNHKQITNTHTIYVLPIPAPFSGPWCLSYSTLPLFGGSYVEDGEESLQGSSLLVLLTAIADVEDLGDRLGPQVLPPADRSFRCVAQEGSSVKKRQMELNDGFTNVFVGEDAVAGRDYRRACIHRLII